MPGFDFLDILDALRRQGADFCVATVVRTADVTSAKAGAKAAVTGDGQIQGHLGGACVQRAVKEASVQAMADGAPRMIRVKPTTTVVPIGEQGGIQTYNSGCPSGGTVDVLIEPYQKAPRLAVLGDTPIARAIRQHAELAGFRVTATDDGLEMFGPRDFVVVASQGQGDRAMLEAALKCDAARVSMVASGKKAQVLVEKLRAGGMEEARLLRLKSPAGLDIGAVDPHEIALSILAEIVQWRNQDAQVHGGGQNEKLA